MQAMILVRIGFKKQFYTINPVLGINIVRSWEIEV